MSSQNKPKKADQIAQKPWDPCAKCMPNPTTGNCPCDNGVVCQYIGYERIKEVQK